MSYAADINDIIEVRVSDEDFMRLKGFEFVAGYNSTEAALGLIRRPITITALQMTRLSSERVLIVPSPGPDFVLYPVMVIAHWKAGLSALVDDEHPLLLAIITTQYPPFGMLINLVPKSKDFWSVNCSANAIDSSGGVAPAGQSLSLFGTADAGIWGGIAGLATNGSGTGYAPNDTGDLPSPDGNATYTIIAVDGSGAPTAVMLTAPGHSFTTRAAVATENSGGQPGSGTGLTLDVTVTTMETGSLDIDLFYFKR